MKKWLFVFVAAGSVFSCCQVNKEPNPELNNLWVLKEMDQFTAMVDTLPEKPSVELNLSEGKYYGFTGCNRLNGGTHATADSIRFSDGPMTRAFCNDQGLEQQFVQLLLGVQTYRLESEVLTLMSENQMKMVFVKGAH